MLQCQVQNLSTSKELMQVFIKCLIGTRCRIRQVVPQSSGLLDKGSVFMASTELAQYCRHCFKTSIFTFISHFLPV